MVSLHPSALTALGLHELWLGSPSSPEPGGPAQAADVQVTGVTDRSDSQESSSCCSIHLP